GFVIIAAEYNHGYPAPLKNALDSLFQEWVKKPAAFVGYGDMGGVRSIEQLATVALQLGMVPLSGTSYTVRIIEVCSAFDDEGNLKPEHTKGNVQKLLSELE